jgi:hypothetical protein
MAPKSKKAAPAAEVPAEAPVEDTSMVDVEVADAGEDEFVGGRGMKIRIVCSIPYPQLSSAGRVVVKTGKARDWRFAGLYCPECQPGANLRRTGDRTSGIQDVQGMELTFYTVAWLDGLCSLV